MELLENTEDLIQLVGFHVGSKFFGADIMSVREILRDPVIEKTDNAPGAIAGIIRLRGQVIPVVNLRERLGGNTDQSKDSANNWVLITQVGELVLGMITDNVTRILRIDPSTILPAPEIIVSGLTTPYIRGVCESEMGMLVVLNFDRLFSADDIEAVKKMDVK